MTREPAPRNRQKRDSGWPSPWALVQYAISTTFVGAIIVSAIVAPNAATIALIGIVPVIVGASFFSGTKR